MLYLIFCELNITVIAMRFPGIPTEEMSRCRTLMATGRDRNSAPSEPSAPSTPGLSSNALELINIKK